MDGTITFVKLDKNYQYSNETDTQFISGIEIKSLTIDGQNHIINANHNARIFNVTGNNVILKNIIKRNRPLGIALILEDSYSFPSGHAMISSAFYFHLINIIKEHGNEVSIYE